MLLALILQMLPLFREHSLATDLKGGYQVVAADVNGDGQTDLIALAQGAPELYWFEAPEWKRHVIARLERMINLAARDLDGDRIPEIVVASQFSNDARKSAGIVSLLKSKGDPTQLWEAKEIDRLPSSHRIRIAEVDKGKPLFFNAPLTGATVAPPEYQGAAPLVYYAPGEWKRQTINEENRGVVHGLTVVDWDGDGRDDLLTASFVGVHLFRRDGSGWKRTEVVKGDPSPWPKSGASEVAVGRMGKQRYLATVEPWHGNQVAVYTQRAGTWQREVIDSENEDIHTINAGDLDGDGSDELVAAVRGPKRRVGIYQFAAGKWNRKLLDDGGIAAANCAIADLNGDRLPDIACIGSATANLKWYENMGMAGGDDRVSFAVVEKIAGQTGFYTSSGKRVAGVPVGNHPHEIVQSPDRKLFYVSDNGILWFTDPGEGGNTISIIDAATRQKAGVIDLGEYRRPHGMDIDRARNRMVTTIENPAGVLLIDLATRKVLRKFDTKGPAPHMVIFDKAGEYAYASNSGGETLAAINLTSGDVKLIPVGKGPQGGVLSADGSRLYLTVRDSNMIAVIDTRKREKVGEIATGKGPARAALTPDGKTLVYNLQFDGTVGFADVASLKQTAAVPIGGRSLSLTMSKDGRWAYAGIQDQDKIVVLSVRDRKVVRAFATPKAAGPDPALPLD